MMSGEAKMRKPFARWLEVVIMGLKGTTEVAGGWFWSLCWGMSCRGTVAGGAAGRWGSHLGYRQSSVQVVARWHLWGLVHPSVRMGVQCVQVHLGLVECEGGSGREAYVSISPMVVMLW